MSRTLSDLHPTFYPLACELIAKFVEAGIPVMIIGTGRTEEEHQANLAKGVSWVVRSKHLDGLAIDVAPYEEFSAHGPDKLSWDAGNPIWAKMADIGESLGLRCGYRWKKKDCGHYEYLGPLPT